MIIMIMKCPLQWSTISNICSKESSINIIYLLLQKVLHMPTHEYHVYPCNAMWFSCVLWPFEALTHDVWLPKWSLLVLKDKYHYFFNVKTSYLRSKLYFIAFVLIFTCIFSFMQGARASAVDEYVPVCRPLL